MAQANSNVRLANIRLGNIRPNRFRDLERWPLERDVIEALKQSIHETGFWNNLQAIYNERGEVELRFGHHRLAAGLELFGPERMVMLEIVPFEGNWNLLRALHLENTIKRNSIAHLHEMVSQIAHWLDDVVFEQCPTWEACEMAGYFTRHQLEEFFGPYDGNKVGRTNYEQAAKYGIGRRVIAKMLAETDGDIRQALANLPLTERRKKGLGLKAQEERCKAEGLQAQASEAKETEEAERLAYAAELATARAKHKEWTIQRGEWFDPKAAEVFAIPSHGAAFRESVCHDAVRPFLETATLVPFAKAIRDELEERERIRGTEQLTAANIRRAVGDNFRGFKETLKLKEQEEFQRQEKNNPALKLRRLTAIASKDAGRFSGSLGQIQWLMETHNITTLSGFDSWEMARDLKDIAELLSRFHVEEKTIVYRPKRPHPKAIETDFPRLGVEKTGSYE